MILLKKSKINKIYEFLNFVSYTIIKHKKYKTLNLKKKHHEKIKLILNLYIKHKFWFTKWQQFKAI